MNGAIGYRLMQGKMGVEGHVRGEMDGERLSIRGLDAGMQCQLYIKEENVEWRSVFIHADGKGQINYQSSGRCRYFAAVQDRVILWEREGGQAENYLQACVLLSQNSHEEACRETAAEEKQEEAAAAEEILCDPKPAASGDIFPAEEEMSAYSLRKIGSGEAIDALPSLFWPEKVKNLQIYFSSLPPFAPFDLPGWRFVRAPSPVAGCAYCAIGYTAANDRVAKMAYALPGIPFHPPANLAGYRYYPGRNGQGYWITVQDAEK